MLFAFMEAGVGIYAWTSPWMFTHLSNHLLDSNHITVAVSVFILLLPATLMMGATLPILVTILAQRRPNVGWATGKLYSSNTLGASLGAFTAGILLFHWLDLQQALILSGAMNIGVAAFTTLLIRRAT